MLAFRWHRRFADQLFRPWGERRLLGFATGGNPQSDDHSEDDETEGAEEFLQEQAGAGRITDIAERMRANVERVRPTVAQAATQSQFVVSVTIDILKDDAFADIDGVRDLIDEGRTYLAIVDRSNDPALSDTERDQARVLAEDTRVVLKDRMETVLSDARVAAAVAEAFERRSRRYDELKRQLGNIAPGALVELEKRLQLENREKLSLNGSELWGDGEIDGVLKELGIDAKIELKADEKTSDNGHDREVQNAIRGIAKQTEISPEDRDATGNPTNLYKLKILRRKFSAARELAIMETNDIGSETTLESATEIERKLSMQVLHARRHLERTLQLEAAELGAKFETLRQKLQADAGGADWATVARHLGVSPLALERRVNEIYDTLQRTLRVARIQTDGGADAGNPENLKKVSDPGFVSHAKRLLAELQDLAWMHSEDAAQITTGFIRGETNDRKGAEAWAAEYGIRLGPTVERLKSDPELLAGIGELLSDGTEIDPDTVQEQLEGLEQHAAVCSRIADGSATADDLDHLYDNLPHERRAELDVIMLAVASPAFLTQIRRDKRAQESDTASNSEEIRDAALTELDAAERALFDGETLRHPALDHEVCRALPIPIGTQLRNLIASTRTKLKNAARMGEPNGTSTVRGCRLDVAKLSKSVKELDKLTQVGTAMRIRSIPAERIAEYEDVSGSRDSLACYNRRDGVIYLNEQAIAAKAAETGQSAEEITDKAVYHERGHAIVDLLMNRIGVLPGLLLALHQTVQQRIPGDASSRTFNDILRSRGEDWGITDETRDRVLVYERKRAEERKLTGDVLEAQAQRSADEYVQEMLLDELVNKYASWKEAGSATQGVHPDDLMLFSLLNTQGVPEDIAIDENAIAERDGPDVALKMSAEDIAAQAGKAEGGDGGAAGAEALSVPLTSKRILDAQNKFLLIRSFIADNPGIKGVDAFAGWVNDWEQAFKEHVEKRFNQRSPEGGLAPEEEILAILDKMDTEFFKPADTQMDTVKAAQVEASQNAQGGGGFFARMIPTEWASINDIIGMCKSIGEDLQRMWKRRGERVQSLLGSSITDWIPDNNIWGLKYAGQLKHEFQRRSSASELAEVQQWKDALKDLDSYSLQTMMGDSKLKDQVRAIAEILYERGRLDFNDEKFWGRLEYLSGMKMPRGSCRNNGVLRDKWLQKMVTAIWGDKDKFFDWRQGNDNGIESGKKKFTQVADQLSNVKDGLKHTLQRQLKLWVENRLSGNIPDEVNPHLYEEVLHYAMRNGKMSMEDKLFYLVQGVRHQLISIDRLQALAGENGQILNRFPFIDYFYGHNNTLPEVAAIGARLEEGTGDARFVPGPKTTLWIQLELLRDEGARARISKATSGTRAENLDHEDIPTIMAQADYTTVDRLTDIVSGSREKMSPEAVRNAYTGFGTKFKILARLAQLDAQGKARFTDADALEAAKSIAAYIHMDNIFTRNGTNDQRRNKIDWAELEQVSPSTGPGLRVKDYRNSNSGFAREVLQAFEGQIDWKSMDTSIDDYFRAPDDRGTRSEEHQKKNFKATTVFNSEILRILKNPGNRETLKRILIQFADQFKEENFGDQISENFMEQYLNERKTHGVPKN